MSTIKKKSKDNLFYLYLLARYQDFNKDQGGTIKTLERFLKKSIQERKKYAYLSIKAYRLLIKNLRYSGSRQRAAKGYRILSAFWLEISLDDLPRFLNRRKLILERINDHLWTARYQALIGNKAWATYYSNLSLAHVEKYKNQFKDKREYYKFLDLYSEAYYLRSFKICIYYGDYKSAQKWSTKALKSRKMLRKWKRDLNWVHGLALFLNKDYGGSIKHWKKSLRYTKRKSTKARTLFWLSEASKQKGNSTLYKRYKDELKTKYPFNFYALLEKSRFLMKASKGSSKKSTLYAKRRRLTRSIIRGEILIQMKRYSLAQAELKYTYRLLRPRRYNKRNMHLYTYINKLLYKARLYHKSISFSEQLARRYRKFWQRNPEQVSLYYPMAFMNHYSKAADDSDVELSLLYGISRQESLFRVNAVSYANAIGLMQITPGTARVLARQLKVSMRRPRRDLKNIKKNLRLGSYYLKKLRKRYRFEKSPQVAMVAAYNAGEYAVDQWIDKIKIKNPLLWIEAIPFRQTRNYVKYVLSNKKIYETLINHSKQESKNYMLYTLAKIEKKI